MSREKTLVKKTIIYAIGNFGSKILAYVMVLVYTYFIDQKEMGYYDLILTTVSLVQPIIIFQMNDGVYRFLVEGVNKGGVLSTGFRFLCCTTVVAEICLLIFSTIHHLEYTGLIALYLASTMIYLYFQDSIRGLGDSKLYALCGVFNSVCMLICEVIGLVGLKLGVAALLASKTIANIACIILLFIKEEQLRCVWKYKFDRTVFRTLFHYSAPLVPNTICWWIVNSSDRYIILFFLGAAYNGLFSVAYKFPTILTTVTSIFYLAWQESAIKEYNSPNRNVFFSNIFRKYYILLFSICICAIPATKIVIELFVSIEYKTAWIYTGFLYLGAVFSALSSFLGMGYQISQETKRSVMTTVLAALINAAVNLGAIHFIGLQAASLSTFVSYLFLFIVRIQHTKRYFILKVNWGQFIWLTILSILLIAIVIFTDSLLLSLGLCIAGGAYLFWLNQELIAPVVNTVLKRFKLK